MKQELRVLGIETSCDETAAAVVARRADAADGPGAILANQLLRQQEHAAYGGVVPELAARAHLHHLDGLVRAALKEAGLRLSDMDAIAATAGPGLIGGVMVGLTTAKALALGAGKTLIGINHLEAHALTIRLERELAFPYLLLLISGGHCQLLAIEGLGKARLYGTTRDDAVGEAFDKGAQMLGLGFPGGPAIEAAAKRGRDTLDLPRPLLGDGGMDFSFSGLKTALWRAHNIKDKDKAPKVEDSACSLQTAIADCLCERTRNACAVFGKAHPRAKTLVVAGGVAANQMLRRRLQATAKAAGFTMLAAAPALCTDNAAMVAWAGAEYMSCGISHEMSLAPRARWALGESAEQSG